MTAQEVIQSLLTQFVQDRLGIKVVLIAVFCAEFRLGLIGKFLATASRLMPVALPVHGHITKAAAAAFIQLINVLEQFLFHGGHFPLPRIFLLITVLF